MLAPSCRNVTTGTASLVPGDIPWHFHRHVLTFNDDRKATQTHSRPREALPRWNVIFESMPRTHENLAIVYPARTPRRFLRGFQRPGQAFALAQRTILMRANIRKGVKLVTDVEDADGPSAQLNQRPAAARKVVDPADPVAGHLWFSPSPRAGDPVNQS